MSIDLSKCAIRTRSIIAEHFGQEANRFIVQTPSYDPLKDATRKDAIIEATLLRVPLPPVYAALDRGERYTIIRGAIYFEVLRDFITGRIELTKPKIFDSVKPNSRFESLSMNLKRRIIETNVTFHLIEVGAPQEFLEEIYKLAPY